MSRGKGPRGGARGGGGASLPASARGTGLPYTLSGRDPWLSALPSRGPLTKLLAGCPGEPRCPDLRPHLADPGRRPVTQAPRGTWEGSSSCSERGPPFPSCRSSPRFCLPGTAFVTVGSRPPPGCGEPVWSGATGEALGSHGFGSSLPYQNRCPLKCNLSPMGPWSAVGKLGDLEGDWAALGKWG